MYFDRSDLPFNNKMLNFWNDNGYVIIENFKTKEECDDLINRSKELIDEQDFNDQQSVFDTVNQSHNDDNYFLDSGDKIRFFFEEKANLNEENIKTNKQYIVNKIGHALHDLDEKFIHFSKSDDLIGLLSKTGRTLILSIYRKGKLRLYTYTIKNNVKLIKLFTVYIINYL